MVTVKQYCLLILTDFIYFCTFCLALAIGLARAHCMPPVIRAVISALFLSEVSFTWFEQIVGGNHNNKHKMKSSILAVIGSLLFCNRKVSDSMEFSRLFSCKCEAHCHDSAILCENSITNIMNAAKNGQKCCETKNGINEFVQILWLETPK